MKNIIVWTVIIVVFGILVTVDYINFKSIAALKTENRTLQQNNQVLLTVNSELSEKMGDFSDILIDKSKWDLKVEAKIRELEKMDFLIDTIQKELNSHVKKLYETTNQNISIPIH